MTSKKPRSDLARVKSLRNLRQVKQFLGLSWRKLATLIPKNGDGHYSHGELIAWSYGTRDMADEQFERICQLIANRLTARYGREIGLHATRNSPWRIKPIIWCNKCNRWHELKRWNQKTH